MLLAVVRLAGLAALLASTILASSPAVLPPTLGPLRLESYLEGDEALRSINRLHGRRIPLVSGLVARYGAEVGGVETSATLWVSEAKDSSEAESLMERMVQGLKGANRSFGHFRSWERGGQTLYGVYGDGQKHVLFRTGPRMVWLAYDPNLPDEIVEEVLSLGKPAPEE